MKASDRDSVCGICGRPLDERHDHDRDGGAAARPGKRVEYVVVGTRGELANYQAAGDPSRTFRTVSADLAAQLGVAESALAGVRFSCWVAPAEYGVVRSDFRLH